MNKISINMKYIFTDIVIVIASYITDKTQLCRKITEMSLGVKPCPVFSWTLALPGVLFCIIL